MENYRFTELAAFFGFGLALAGLLYYSIPDSSFLASSLAVFIGVICFVVGAELTFDIKSDSTDEDSSG
ncbi:MAG: hypothetical protein J07AB43_14980 [Candidatus Nanosalina sp. J07AB43]|nr:MAG: hypothetical protein J07AB43_14980 [Candidatus Nanosalina sp. J07AB43]